MASANLRYLALRSRLPAVIQSWTRGEEPDDRFAEALVRELYRALVQLHAVAVYAVGASELTLLAAQGTVAAATLPLHVGVPGAALATNGVVDNRDRRADRDPVVQDRRPGSELAVALRPPGERVLVVDVLIGGEWTAGASDRDLLAWLARTVASEPPAPRR